MDKTAIVLFNLGGPDNASAVRPFLFNLFYDRAIIDLPNPFRYLLARLISTRRAPIAQKIYQNLGGRSPILPQTVAQAEALETKLSAYGNHKVFISMRYWHPMSAVVAKKVKAYDPDRIILLPLYPQFSTTTTGSSFDDWKKACTSVGLNKKTNAICCYPEDASFLLAHAQMIVETYKKASDIKKPRLLFSAHGLPEKIIEKGDPYQMQVEKTAKAIVELMRIEDIDYVVCYQSRVGRLKWIEPYTEDEIIRAGKDGVPLVIVPIAFVSEHSETLVELDMEYRQLAEEHGVPSYWRVPALCDNEIFIEALASLCLNIDQNTTICSAGNKRFCHNIFEQCPCKLALIGSEKGDTHGE